MSEVMFENVVNFRDFGGVPAAGGQVRRGVLFRSAHFGEATEADVAALSALGVRVVIDFRGPADKEQEGHNRLPPTVREVLLPMYDPARGNDARTLLYLAPPHEVAAAYPPGRAFEQMRLASQSFVTNPDRRRQYGEMLRVIIDAAGDPVLIHCSAGKDRTGWGAAVVLLALGVPRLHIVADYLRSIGFRQARGARLEELAAAGIDPAVLEPFFTVHEDYINAGFAAMDTHFGGADGYLRDGLGIAGADLDRFREVMIEPH